VLAAIITCELPAQNLFLRTELAFYRAKTQVAALNAPARVALTAVARFFHWRRVSVVVRPDTFRVMAPSRISSARFRVVSMSFVLGISTRRLLHWTGRGSLQDLRLGRRLQQHHPLPFDRRADSRTACGPDNLAGAEENEGSRKRQRRRTFSDVIAVDGRWTCRRMRGSS
jgi:hypothetical protein